MNRFPQSCERRSVATKTTFSTHARSRTCDRDYRGSRAAFTLIELLSVVAIIGVLAAIMIPSVAAIRESAKTSRCVSNLRQVGVAIQAYTNDNKGSLPSTGFYGVSSRYNRDQRNFQNQMLNYIALNQSDTWANSATANTYSAIFDCPAYKGDFGGKCYTMQKSVASITGTNVNPWGVVNENGVSTAKAAKLATISPKAQALLDYEPTTTELSHGTFRNALYFDWHVGQVAMSN